MLFVLNKQHTMARRPEILPETTPEKRLIISEKVLNVPLRGYECTSFIDATRGCNTSTLDIKPSMEYLQISVNVTCTYGSSGTTYEIEPLSKMIESIRVSRSGFGIERGTETSSIFYGEQLWLLSYLNDEPHDFVIINIDMRGTATIQLPYVIMTSRDVHVAVSFRKDIDEHIQLEEINLYAISTNVRHKIIGNTTKQSLIPKGTTCLGIRDTKVLCGFVLHAKGCQVKDMQLELRDGSNLLIGFEDIKDSRVIGWNTLDFVRASPNTHTTHNTRKPNNLQNIGETILSTPEIHECLFSCRLPWLDTTQHLRLHIKAVNIELIRNIELNYVALHAPESEGWVILERGKQDNTNNETRMQSMKKYIASWVSIPAWAKKKKVVVTPSPVVQVSHLDIDIDDINDIPTALEISLAREEDLDPNTGLEEIPLPPRK